MVNGELPMPTANLFSLAPSPWQAEEKRLQTVILSEALAGRSRAKRRISAVVKSSNCRDPSSSANKNGGLLRMAVKRIFRSLPVYSPESPAPCNSCPTSQ